MTAFPVDLPTTLNGLVMATIHWDASPEGSDYWNPLFEYSSWRNSDRDYQLAAVLVEKYPNPGSRTKQSQKNYRRALKLIAKYEERFGNLPSIELLQELL